MTCKHKWIPYAFGAQVCAKCGINRASTGYKYPKRKPTKIKKLVKNFTN